MRKNLDEMAVKAIERGMTYGQLQAQETLRMMKEDREREERIRQAYERAKMAAPERNERGKQKKRGRKRKESV